MFRRNPVPRLAGLVLVATLFAWTSAVAAPEPPVPPAPPEPPSITTDGRDRVAVGDDVTVKAGEHLEGDVVCVQGNATIDGEVDGDVVVVAGRLRVTGKVNGGVVGVASRVKLEPGATVGGDVVNVAGTLTKDGASIEGQTVNLGIGWSSPGWFSGWGGFGGLFDWFAFWTKFFLLFLFFVGALLMSALVPDRIRLISDEAPHQVFTAFLFGLLGYILLCVTQLVLIVTIVGIPLVFLLYVAFVILKWMAMAGLFHQIGLRIRRALGREMSFLGAILLGFLPFALLRFVPFCIGSLVWFLIEIVAFGYLILTRVGTRRGPIAGPPAPPPQPAS